MIQRSRFSPPELGWRRNVSGSIIVPPLAAGARVTLLGDSIFQYGAGQSGQRGAAAPGGINRALPTLGIAAGGTGYTVGDILTLSGGTTVYQTAQVQVTSVSAGVITGLSLVRGGSYEVSPSSPNAVTGGTGSGASITFSASTRGISNLAQSELHWAKGSAPNFQHVVWHDHTATVPNLIPTYGFALAVEPVMRGNNLGFAGDSASGNALRVAQALGTGAEVIVVNAGTNFGAGDSAATVQTKLAEILTAINGASRRPIIGTVRPRQVSLTPTGSQISQAERDRILQINDWIRANFAAYNATLWDPWESLRDRSLNPGDALYGTVAAGLTGDGVHLSQLGAYTSALSNAFGAISLRAALDQLIQTGTWFNPDPTTSNILANGRFTGTTGTIGAGASGIMPTGWAASVVGANATVACSLVANSETGGQSVVLDITSNGAGAANTFSQVVIQTSPAPTTGFVSTDFVQLTMRAAFDGGNILPHYQTFLGSGSTINNRSNGQSGSAYNSDPAPFVALTKWFESEPMLVSTRTSLNPRLSLHIRNDLAGTTRVVLERAILRVVPNPQTQAPWVP